MSAWVGSISLMADRVETGFLGDSKCIPLTLKRKGPEGTTTTVMDLMLHVPVNYNNSSDEPFYQLICDLQEAFAKIAKHHRSKDNAEAESNPAV